MIRALTGRCSGRRGAATNIAVKWVQRLQRAWRAAAHCLLAVSGMALAQPDSGKPLIVGSEEDYPPFATGRTVETAGGFTVDLWKAVAKENGLNYTLRVRSFREILEEFKAGKIDVLINLAQSDERRAFADFSVPHVIVHGAIFVRKSESSIHSETDLAGKSIIVMHADLAHDHALSQGWGPQLVLVDNAAEGLKLLASGKHDAMLISKLAGLQTLQGLKIRNVKALDTKAGFSQKFSFAVRKGNADLLAKVNEGLALAKSAGAYDALYEKWFGVFETREVTIRQLLKYLGPIAITLLIGTGLFFVRQHERKKAERRLRDSEERLRLALSAAHQGLYDLNVQTGEVIVSPEYALMFGYDPAEFHETHAAWRERLHPEDREPVTAAYSDYVAGRRADYRVEFRQRTKNGKWIWVLSLGSLVGRSPDGRPLRMLGTHTNITERKKVEQALATTTSLLERTGEIAKVGGWELNLRTMQLFWSLETCRIHEVEPAVAPALDDAINFYAPEARPIVRAAVQAGIEHGTPWDLELPMLTARGRPIWVRAYGAAVVENGKAVKLVGAIHDITEARLAQLEREQLDRKVQETQKLESLGVLAGGIAHDFNNLLTSILGNASIAEIQLPADSCARDCLEQITEASLRAADLCNQMLAYSGRGRFVVQKIDLATLVEQTGQLLQISTSKKAVLRYRHEKGLPPIEADATQIRQVIMNLVINASEAIGDKNGVIHLSTGLTQVDRNYLRGTRLDSDLPVGDYVYLEVSDDGCGMSVETQARIFDPFFTTKFTGRGLGLAAVLGIVRGHKGVVMVDSELDRGTTFKLLFPAAKGASEHGPSRTVGGANWQGKGTVLVVDDEETMRSTVARMIRIIGLEPVLACDGREAIEVFRVQPDRFALVLLDLTMPHMDGEQTFTQLRRLRPDVRVVLMSGFNAQEVLVRFPGKGPASFLQKPFTVAALSATFKEVLAASDPLPAARPGQ